MKKYMVKESQYKPLENKIIGLELFKGNGPQEPRPPRKTLDERIAEAVSKSLVPVITRLDQLQSDVNDLKIRITKVENRVENIEARLNKQDEFNKVISEYMETRLNKQDEFNKVVSEYMDSHP